MSTIDEVSNLIISEHQKPKFIDWVVVLVDKAKESSLDTSQYFNVDTAIGKQLDIIGEYVGVSRVLTFKPKSTGGTTVLDDDLYRLVIYAQIAKNSWDGTMPSIKNLWRILLPEKTLIVIDNLDMSIDVIVYGTKSDLERELIDKLYFVPKPAGVRTNYQFPTNEPAFGYDADTQYIKGYDKGVWIRGIS